ncbi:MAG: hypothetical protein WA446_20920, partial [Steroidobacteraceae bacterium]
MSQVKNAFEAFRKYVKQTQRGRPGPDTEYRRVTRRRISRLIDRRKFTRNHVCDLRNGGTETHVQSRVCERGLRGAREKHPDCTVCYRSKNEGTPMRADDTC